MVSTSGASVVKPTNGSSWNSLPMPCPPYSRTTLKPASSTVFCTASAITDSGSHGLTAARPASTLARVTSTRRWRSAETSPMQNIRLESLK